MSVDTARRVRFWYGIFLSVFTVVMGILFLAQISDIYFNSDLEQKYTREIVWQHLFPVLIPFCFWVAAIIAGFVLSVVFPCASNKKKKRTAYDTLQKLRGKIPQGEGEEFNQNLAKYKKAELWRIIVWCVCAAVCVASIIATFVYIFNPANFPAKSLNGEVLAMARFVLPFVAVSILFCCGAVVFEGVLSKTQLNYVKNMIKIGGKINPTREDAFVAVINKNEKWVILGLRIALFVIGVAFIIAGSINGGANDVLVKATKICTECIGLG